MRISDWSSDVCSSDLGGLTVAINALQSVSSPHRFLGINQEGGVSIVTTKGNAYGDVVLRGGNGIPNYDSVSVALCEQALNKAKIKRKIIVDCNHANDNKDPAQQPRGRVAAHTSELQSQIRHPEAAVGLEN